MDIFWQSFFGFLEKLGLLVVPLIAAYIGWRLSQKTYVRQLLVDSLKNKFDALREIKSVIGNIPPDLNKEGLIERLSNDDDFRKSLTNRMVRFFGLRNELIPLNEPKKHIAQLQSTPVAVKNRKKVSEGIKRKNNGKKKENRLNSTSTRIKSERIPPPVGLVTPKIDQNKGEENL